MKIIYCKFTHQLTAFVNPIKDVKVIWDKEDQRLTVMRGCEKLKSEPSPVQMTVHFFTEYCQNIERIFV
jgi:hypothetical protein